MKILPFRKFTYNTMLPAAEIRKRLDRITLGFASKENRYEGKVNESSFQISRRINYRNSFLPVIIGEVEATEAGSIVNVKIRLNWFAIVCAIISYSIVLYLMITPLFGDISLRKDALFPSALFILFTLLFTIPFAVEANIAQKDLSRIFECEPHQG